MKDADKIIYKLTSLNESIGIDNQDTDMKDLVKNIDEYKLNFINKNVLELEMPCEMKIISDFIPGDFPLFSSKLKNILDTNEVDNIYYKPVYLINSLLDDKFLYWIPIIPRINCLGKDYDEVRYVIGNFKIFRDKKRDSKIIFITDELKNILEKSNLNGITFKQVTQI